MNTRPTSTGHDTFQYPPLPAGVDGIRIFNLGPGEFSDPLIGTLTPVAFGAKPKYVALSYTWNDSYTDNARLPTSPEERKPPHQPARYAKEQGLGLPENYLPHQLQRDPSELGSKVPLPNYNEVPAITLNNHPFHIDHNLYLALLHLRSPTFGLTLWIDALCINQKDKDERNAQVAMMSFIYMRAIKVVGWLGIKDYNEPSGLFRRMTIEWKAGQSQHFAASLSQEGKLRCSLEPDQGTFARIAKSSYWTRLWIVQEMCIPRLLVLVYGPNIWTYEDFTEWRALRTARSHQPSQLVPDKQNEALIRLSNARDARHTEIMKLETLIEIFASSGCSEWRDRVYGLLGLANDICPTSSQDSSNNPIEIYINSFDMQQDNLPEPERGVGFFMVDYSRSLYDIWVDVVKFVFFRAKSIKRNFSFTAETVLQNNIERIKTATLLDRRERALSVVRTAGLVQEALGQKVDEIASLNHLKHAHIGPIIRAVGYLSGKIVQLGPDNESLVESFRVHRDWINSWDKHYDKPEELEILRRMGEEYTVRTMVYERKDLDRIQEIRNPKVIAWRMQRNRPQSSEIKHTTAWDFANSKVSAQSSRPRICLGTSCTIAMVPSAAKVGDVVVRFWNCSAAVVMRPVLSDAGSPASSFMLVGRADVAEYLDSDGASGRNAGAEERWLYVPDPKDGRLQASGAVYIDLDFQTLQIVTASINSRRRM